MCCLLTATARPPPLRSFSVVCRPPRYPALCTPGTVLQLHKQTTIRYKDNFTKTIPVRARLRRHSYLFTSASDCCQYDSRLCSSSRSFSGATRSLSMCSLATAAHFWRESRAFHGRDMSTAMSSNVLSIESTGTATP